MTTLSEYCFLLITSLRFHWQKLMKRVVSRFKTISKSLNNKFFIILNSIPTRFILNHKLYDKNLSFLFELQINWNTYYPLVPLFLLEVALGLDLFRETLLCHNGCYEGIFEASQHFLRQHRVALKHLMPLVSFYIHWKHQKTWPVAWNGFRVWLKLSLK